MASGARGRVQPLRALRAMRALVRDPDDTAQVFTIVEALSGKNGERTLRRFRKTAVGRRVLAERRVLLDRLADRERLRALPEGSLGRAYLAFLEREQITAEGLVGASDAGRIARSDDADLRLLSDRMRDQHDLWHTVTGYHGDVLGEAALLAFTFAQTWNPGVGLIVGVAILESRRHPEMRRLIVRGFSRGLRAAWLPAADWEALLALPLEEVRRRLRVGQPPAYVPMRTSDPAVRQAMGLS
jgi:ubiquinone biosynthesis protein COQ4